MSGDLWGRIRVRCTSCGWQGYRRLNPLRTGQRFGGNRRKPALFNAPCPTCKGVIQRKPT